MYDSASRTVRAFEPLRPHALGVYNCGPTVYDYQHIGNLYTYLTADIARRTFEYLGYDVKQDVALLQIEGVSGTHLRMLANPESR